MALPANQQIPKTVLKRPYAVPRLCYGAKSAIAALVTDSWAPIPKPQRTTPKSGRSGGLEKTRKGKGSASEVAPKRTGSPTLS
jgi:hypothetical protein